MYDPAREVLAVRFVRQRGAYADITSVLNGAARLPRGPVYVAYADNLYPHTNALDLLAAVPGDTTAVLARPFTTADAGGRGVIVTDPGGQMMTALAEKPDPAHVARLLDLHGPSRLRLLEGRFRLTADLVDRLRGTLSRAHSGEPRLSLAVAAHARTRPVHVVTTTGPVVDLGAAPAHLRRPPSPPGRRYACRCRSCSG